MEKKFQAIFVKKITDSFLQNTKQILLTGIVKEDVSNNAIISQKRLIEKDAVVNVYPFAAVTVNQEDKKLADLENLIKLCQEILTDNFLFMIINTYSSNLPLVSLENILKLNFHNKKITVDDLCLPIENSELYLSCGITGRVINE